MNQALTQTINLQNLWYQAQFETLTMKEQGMDISDPSLVTPLEVVANDYPEIADLCNQSLRELIQEQQKASEVEKPLDIVPEF